MGTGESLGNLANGRKVTCDGRLASYLGGVEITASYYRNRDKLR